MKSGLVMSFCLLPSCRASYRSALGSHFLGVVTNMSTLEELDLSHNELTHLRKGLIGPLPNLTRLDLSHNLMLDIPVNEIAASPRLQHVDLRSNRLTRFYDEFMPLLERNGTAALLMEGNPVVCDCRLRPLQFWLGGLEVGEDDPWLKTICSGPALIAGQPLATVDDESLNCKGVEAAASDRLKYAVLKDIVFRDVLGSGSSITYSWYVQRREDVSDFAVEIRQLQEGKQAGQPDLLGEPVLAKDIGYGLRSDRVDGLDRPTRYVVCIRARTSLGYLRPWKPNQCQPVVSGAVAASSLHLLPACFLFAMALHLFLSC